MPALLFPRKVIFGVILFYLNTVYVIEKYVLGLNYEIRGIDHLPKSGMYIVAAKHESAYETLKLHRLFDNPAIILKQELLRIPIWGQFLKTIDPIAINRQDRKGAMKQITNAVLSMKENKDQNQRAIIIFPQGTRVYPWQTPDEKPYKIGAVKIQAETDLPLIPLALNTGVFWPRKGFFKFPGRIIFEFLPPVTPEKELDKTLKKLEHTIEERSNTLKHEALTAHKFLPRPENKEESTDLLS